MKYAICSRTIRWVRMQVEAELFLCEQAYSSSGSPQILEPRGSAGASGVKTMIRDSPDALGNLGQAAAGEKSAGLAADQMRQVTLRGLR